MIKYKKFIGMWNPEEHKEIEGKILNVESEVKFQEYVYDKRYTIETKDAVVQVLGSTVLDTKLRGLNVHNGMYIKIIFNGLKKGDKKEYKDFDVYLGVD